MEGNEPVTPAWRGVAIDVTHNYEIAEDDKPFIKRILDVFIYDVNEHTYCCEITPSHWMIYVQTEIDFDYRRLHRRKHYDGISERLEMKYAHEQTDDCYMHVSDVAAMLSVELAGAEDSDEAREVVVQNQIVPWPKMKQVKKR